VPVQSRHVEVRFAGYVFPLGGFAGIFLIPMVFVGVKMYVRDLVCETFRWEKGRRNLPCDGAYMC
jgi:hypothetical protein